MLGYSWCGCTNGEEMRPRAKEWDMEFGEPTAGACAETGKGTGVFERSYSRALVQWDCNAGHGRITPKQPAHTQPNIPSAGEIMVHELE